MTAYRPPLSDMAFVLRDLAGLENIAALPGFEDCSADLVTSVLEEAGRIASEVVAPLNQPGDIEGARLAGDGVKTAAGWKEAYRTLADGNWIGLAADARHGGMGLPGLVGAAVSEMWQAAGMAFGLSPMLTQAAITAIAACGSEAQKDLYIPKLASGEWAGAMDLTEAGAGSDLAAVKTRARREAGGYKISGQKIFITYGDHDLTDNIIHLVLARTPDAPPGVKGISLFVVPKFRIRPDGSVGEANDVRCIALEHKLGIHASPTAVMTFGDEDACIGELIGQEGCGLQYMFVMMNHARLNVGLQSVGVAERAYQQALAHARERMQGRPVGASAAAPIVDHPDVRRMLMTIKAGIEAMRALAYQEAAALDRAAAHPDEAARERSRAYADLLNPIVKGWCAEQAVTLTSLALQVHGGAGYVEGTGIAQLFRDARIAPIYEGTTAIQANDLLYRKILRDQGATLRAVLLEAATDAAALQARQDETLTDIGRVLDDALRQCGATLDWLLETAPTDARTAAAAAVPLLMMLGAVLGGHQMAKAAGISASRLATGQGDGAFHRTKIRTAWYYAEAILIQAVGSAAGIVAGSRTVMALTQEEL